MRKPVGLSSARPFCSIHTRKQSQEAEFRDLPTRRQKPIWLAYALLERCAAWFSVILLV